MSKTKLSLAVFSAIIGISPMVATAEETKGEGFVEGSSLNILNRNFYMNRDFRDGQSSSTGNGYSEAWAHGVMVNFESGFTEGTVGLGIDAFAMLGIKLDTGDGRFGPGGSINLLPVNSDEEAEDEYSKLGGAVKAQLFDTVIKAGDVFPMTPVLHYGDSRLLPESFKGVTVVNNSVDGLTLQGGRVHAMSQPQQSGMSEDFLLRMAIAGVQVNLVLMALNLLPILPLDGGRIVMSLLPDRWAWNYARIEPYGILIVVVLLASGLLWALMEPIMALGRGIVSLFL